MIKDFFAVIAIVAVVAFLSYANDNNNTQDISVTQADTSKLVLLENKYDTILFNKNTNTAVWCKWRITSKSLNAQNADRKNYPFVADENPLLNEINKVTTYDYNNSGYDRGHLAPACDMRFSTIAMQECMEMTNITPQTKELNRGIWSALENDCRKWAKKYGSVYVVCGPLYTTTDLTYIGNQHKIAIPQKYFKAVYCSKKGYEKAIGFIVDNTENPQTELKDCVVKVDDIEKLINADFFSWVDDRIENKVESYSNLNDW